MQFASVACCTLLSVGAVSCNAIPPFEQWAGSTPVPLDKLDSPGYFDVGIGFGYAADEAFSSRQGVDGTGVVLSLRAYPAGRWYSTLAGKRDALAKQLEAAAAARISQMVVLTPESIVGDQAADYYTAIFELDHEGLDAKVTASRRDAGGFSTAKELKDAVARTLHTLPEADLLKFLTVVETELGGSKPAPDGDAGQKPAAGEPDDGKADGDAKPKQEDKAKKQDGGEPKAPSTGEEPPSRSPTFASMVDDGDGKPDKGKAVDDKDNKAPAAPSKSKLRVTGAELQASEEIQKAAKALLATFNTKDEPADPATVASVLRGVNDTESFLNQQEWHVVESRDRWFHRLAVYYGKSVGDFGGSIDANADVVGLSYDVAPQFALMAGWAFFDDDAGANSTWFFGTSLNLNAFREFFGDLFGEG